eukprot:GHRQ01038759.1.p2 GENE.GHRQ01038759.1~~GHRQ01038759.1.p2  ORF type:complete len:138 (+),score=36.48 GHRQ01038759.1:427-840(+)
MVGDVLRSTGDFRKVSLRQMSGMLVMVFVRAELEPHIGEVATASVACGVLGYGGNKGAVAVTFSLFRRRVVVVSSHFAAHQVRVGRCMCTCALPAAVRTEACSCFCSVHACLHALQTLCLVYMPAVRILTVIGMHSN